MSKSPSLRRIQADIRELLMDPSTRYHAAPLENDMFEWHFTIRGAEGTDFDGGFYHGRILLPPEYPFKPPNIVFLTPSGRFETGVKVCLSFSAYHPELWQPAWGIRLILEALVSFLPSPADGAIGALDWTPEERRKLAKKSVDYACPTCGKCSSILLDMEKRLNGKEGRSSGSNSNKFQKEIEQLHVLQAATEGLKGDKNQDVPDKVEDIEHEDDGVLEHEMDRTCEKNLSLINENDEIQDVKEEAESDSLPTDVLCTHKDDSNKKDETAHEDTLDTNAGVTDDVEPPVVEYIEQENQGRETLTSPILTDPMANLGILVFSIIVYLMIRKIQALMDDFIELEAQFKN